MSLTVTLSDRNKLILLRFIVISDAVNKCIIAICIAGMGNWLNVEDDSSSDPNKVYITKVIVMSEVINKCIIVISRAETGN